MRLLGKERDTIDLVGKGKLEVLSPQSLSLGALLLNDKPVPWLWDKRLATLQVAHSFHLISYPKIFH